MSSIKLDFSVIGLPSKFQKYSPLSKFTIPMFFSLDVQYVSIQKLRCSIRPPLTIQTQTNSQLPLSDHYVAYCLTRSAEKLH